MTIAPHTPISSLSLSLPTSCHHRSDDDDGTHTRLGGAKLMSAAPLTLLKGFEVVMNLTMHIYTQLGGTAFKWTQVY